MSVMGLGKTPLIGLGQDGAILHVVEEDSEKVAHRVISLMQ
jgi:hypothetical protein